MSTDRLPKTSARAPSTERIVYRHHHTAPGVSPINPVLRHYKNCWCCTTRVAMRERRGDNAGACPVAARGEAGAMA